MHKTEKVLKIYHTPQGGSPFVEWHERLRDGKARAVISVRIARIRVGNLGDCKPVGHGVMELRIHYGPGYRVYFGQDGNTIVVLLLGGDKDSQRTNIAKARSYWEEYRRHCHESG